MMWLLVYVRMLLLIVSTSYVTLGIADSHQAQQVWAPYAATVLALAVINYRACREPRR